MHQQIASDPERKIYPHGWRTIRHFAYVDRPFRDVRRALAAAPQSILAEPAGPASGAAPRTGLRVRRAGFDLARDVRMIIGDIEIGPHSARLPISWEDATRPGLFPILDATFEVAPVRAGRRAMTQLGLFGRYQPPFGRFGGLADSLAGHQIVVESVERFLDDLARRFEVELPAPENEPDQGDAGSADRETRARRRIILPVDGLDRSPGGAAGLGLRLLGEPGVIDATVSPLSGLAVIDYDGSTCDVARLVDLLGADD